MIGQRLISLAAIAAMRGRIDDAAALRSDAVPLLAANPEPQAEMFPPQVDGLIALGRGALDTAARELGHAANLLRAYTVDAAPEILVDAVRVALAVGRRDLAERHRVAEGETHSVVTKALARSIDGLLEPDPATAREVLGAAVADLERLGMRVHAARTAIDLGRVTFATGLDGRPHVEHGRSLLERCDARLFLVEADRAVGRASRG